MLMSYRLLRMEPVPANIPGHPEVIGQLDVDLEAGWPPVVALFIDVGVTPAELVPAFVERTVGSLRGLFPDGRTLFVPIRDGRGTHLYRLEPEPEAVDPELTELRAKVEHLEDLIRRRDDRIEELQSEAWRGSGC